MDSFNFYEYIPNVITFTVVVVLIVISRCFVNPIVDSRTYNGMKDSLIGSENFHSIRKYTVSPDRSSDKSNNWKKYDKEG